MTWRWTERQTDNTVDNFCYLDNMPSANSGVVAVVIAIVRCAHSFMQRPVHPSFGRVEIWNMGGQVVDG